MIDRTVFRDEWRRLVARFGQQWDKEQALAYLEFLSPHMDTAEFQSAARSLWAVAKWFPRPADFLLAASGEDWEHAIGAIELCTPPEWGWSARWQQISSRGQDACRRLGGIPAMRTAWQRDPLRLKTEWERAYEQSTAREALLLPSPPELRALP